MDYVAFLTGVAPGAACTIPEDKKIFRVRADEAGVRLLGGLEPGAPAGEADETPPLPVPHMYSA